MPERIGRWTRGEEMRFIALRANGAALKDITAHLFNRSLQAYQWHWQNVLLPRIQQEDSSASGRGAKADSEWTLDQDTKLLNLGEKGSTWSDIQEAFPGQDIVSLSIRYSKIWKQQKPQEPSEENTHKPKEGNYWTDDANQRLLMLREGGATFTEIARDSLMEGRNANSIKVHYYSPTMQGLRSLLARQRASSCTDQAVSHQASTDQASSDEVLTKQAITDQAAAAALRLPPLNPRYLAAFPTHLPTRSRSDTVAQPQEPRFYYRESNQRDDGPKPLPFGHHDERLKDSLC